MGGVYLFFLTERVLKMIIDNCSVSIIPSIINRFSDFNVAKHISTVTNGRIYVMVV